MHSWSTSLVGIACTLVLATTSCSRESDSVDGSILQSVSSGDQSEAYGHCSQILANGIFDDSVLKDDFSSKEVLVDAACSTFNSYNGAKDERWSKECNSSSNSSGGEFGIDAVIKAVPIGLDAGYQEGSSDSYCKDEGSRRSYRKTWFEHMCKNRMQSKEIKRNTNQVLKSVNQGVVDAWKSCISQRHTGLTCIATKAGEGFNFDVSYDPDALAPDRISLEFQVTDATPVVLPLPSQMGRGNIKRAFRFTDWTKSPSIIVTASSAIGGQVSCDVQLPPQEARTCSNGNVVGVQSNTIYETNAKLCKQIDKCEMGRLKGVFQGKIDWDDYSALVADQWSVFFATDGRAIMAPCNP